jgi:hypothetical protein
MNNITLLSAGDLNYKPLAAITWFQNKVNYCNKHNYSGCYGEYEFRGIPHGFEKIMLIKHLFSTKNISWLWWTGCDSMITNFNVKLEDIIDENYHFIIGVDLNGMNADSFLIRNSKEGNEYLDMILSRMNSYLNPMGMYEQQIMWETYEEYKGIIKQVPQRTFNSYDYSYLPWPAPQLDKLGNDGNWVKGDFLIQWPAMQLHDRIARAQNMLTEVIV